MATSVPYSAPLHRGKNDVVDRLTLGALCPQKPTQSEHPNIRTHSIPRSYWASARGTGGFHFPVHNDDWVLKRDNHLQVMYNQTEMNKEKKFDFIRHGPTDAPDFRDKLPQGKNFLEPGLATKLCKYDINGKIYASSTRNTPPPEQDPTPAHWICQVNGTTNQYNIVNNELPNKTNFEYRNWEIDRFREGQANLTIPAGSTQPPPVITCHQMPFKFVPIRQKIYSNYALVKPNL